MISNLFSARRGDQLARNKHDIILNKIPPETKWSLDLGLNQSWATNISNSLTHRYLVTPYGDKDLG